MTKTQRNKLTKLMSIACRTRDGNVCIRCGETETLCASHIYPKGRHPQMRWDLLNVKTLCYGCHIHFFHKNPIDAAAWIKTALPKERLDYLKKESLRTGLKKIYKYEEIKKGFESVINSLL